MNFLSALNGEAYEEWLGKATASYQVRQAAPLDPFATSLRHITFVERALLALASGQSLDGDAEQKKTDLRKIGVLGEESPSVLGERTLEAWREAGVSSGFEDVGKGTKPVLKCVILIREAIKLGNPSYLQFIDRWRQLRESFEATPLLANSWLLYAYSYYNQMIDGYNPWNSLKFLPLDALTRPSATSFSAAQTKLNTRIVDAETRPEGRRQFCAALECHLLSKSYSALSAFLTSIDRH